YAPGLANYTTSTISRPTWNVSSAPRYASIVMYANVNAGHAQLFVSRRVTASVETHCRHSAMNTITDSATGTAYRPRTGSFDHSRRTACLSPAAFSSPGSPTAFVSTSPTS